MGNSLIPMMITSLGVCALRVIWIFFVAPFWSDVKMVIISYPLTWVITSILFIVYYRYYKKKKLFIYM